MFGHKRNSLFAFSILIGTIIGAGVFGLPYVISRSGIIPGLFYFLFLGGIVLLIHLFFGEIILRTRGDYRLVGLGKRYLGSFANKFLSLSVVIGVLGSLLAYIVIGGEFLKILTLGTLNLSLFQAALVFWLILFLLFYRGVKTIMSAEVLTNVLFFLITGFIICFCLPKFNISNFSIINLKDIFLPYGVILYSFVGWSAIPEIIEVLKSDEDKKKIKKIIILSVVVAAMVYLAFTLAVVGVSGNSTTEDAFSGLLSFLGRDVVFWGAFAGLLTIADSFLVIALYLFNTFIYDFKKSKTFAIIFCYGIPLVLFLIGLRSFIEIIGFVGTLLGTIEVILIILIFKKAKKEGDRKPEYEIKIPSFFLYLLMVIFILGAITQFLK